MFSSFVPHWKTVLVGFAALTATITPTPSPRDLTNPNAVIAPASTNASHNWSGYIATGGQFTSVSGSWTIPTVTGNGHTSADATWVGIGGVTNADLIQSGTQNIVAATGQVTTSAFYELLPNVSQSLPIPVKPGDSIKVSITEQSTNQWQISFYDVSLGQKYLINATYTSSLSSAEWIVEAPSDNSVTLPLDAFGTVQFSAGATNRGTIGASNGQPVTMVNTSNQVLASVGGLTSDGTGFTVTRANATTTSPILQFDRNPGGWRRHGSAVGGFQQYLGNYRQRSVTPQNSITPTATSAVSPTPTYNGTPYQNEQGRGFGPFLRNFLNRFSWGSRL